MLPTVLPYLNTVGDPCAAMPPLQFASSPLGSGTARSGIIGSVVTSAKYCKVELTSQPTSPNHTTASALKLHWIPPTRFHYRLNYPEAFVIMAPIPPSDEKAFAAEMQQPHDSEHDDEVIGIPDWDQDVAMALVGEHAHAVDPAVEARVIRKIDRFMIPAMIIGYGFVYYDKVYPAFLSNLT